MAFPAFGPEKIACNNPGGKDLRSVPATPSRTPFDLNQTSSILKNI
jgi:hypothetical protein